MGQDGSRKKISSRFVYNFLKRALNKNVLKQHLQKNVFSVQGTCFIFSKGEFSTAKISGESFASMLDGQSKNSKISKIMGNHPLLFHEESWVQIGLIGTFQNL